MIIVQHLSRSFLFLIAMLMFSSGVEAEIFIGSNTSVNSLTVVSNEVILISATRVDNNFFPIIGQVNFNGTMQPFGMDGVCQQSLALAGPATLNFPSSSGTNSLPVCICFQRIKGTSIQSCYVPYGVTNFFSAISIPTGKTCHFFRPICSNQYGATEIFANVQAASNTVNNIQILGGEEFSGPATLTFVNNSPDNFGNELGAIISFYLVDDALNLPSGVLQGSTGSFMITVEKSSDLTNWTPIMIQSTGESQAAFYRLNFSH